MDRSSVRPSVTEDGLKQGRRWVKGLRRAVATRGRVSLVISAVLAVVGVSLVTSSNPGTARATGMKLNKHVIVITQENRSFDQYFGTFRGADGFPAGVCVPDPATGMCVKPFHDATDRVNGGPHGAANATADINGGKMDGFVAQAEQAKSPDPHDVMSYKNKREI